MKNILSIIFGILMIIAGGLHVLNPGFYEPLIPPFISPTLANMAATIVEIAVGVLLIIPKTRRWGGLAFMLLMVAFLPLHVWDLVRNESITGSKAGAAIRLLIQFGLIALGWWLGKRK